MVTETYIRQNALKQEIFSTGSATPRNENEAFLRRGILVLIDV